MNDLFLSPISLVGENKWVIITQLHFESRLLYNFICKWNYRGVDLRHQYLRSVSIKSNYEEKEAKVLVKIADVLNKLDSNLEELDSLNEDAKKHSMRKWLVEKKAMHEIKKIAHEAGKYEKYDEKDL